MKSAPHGRATSVVEVTNISANGFWILIGDTELFVSFEDFPWFRQAAVGQILNVELPSEHHLYWPELDIDLAVDSIHLPDKFPLVSKVEAQKPSRPATGAGQVRDRARPAKRPGHR
jgi:hypothetical protein